MKRHAAFAMMLLGLTAGASAVQAADYVPLPPPEEPIEYVPSGGWYIRGDAGYIFSSETSGDYKFRGHGLRYDHGTSSYHDEVFYETHHYDEIRLEKALMVGGGVGYQLNDFSRFDVTVNYFNTEVEGSSSCPYNINGGACGFDDHSEADIWTAMANAYIDLGVYGRFTPYVGAGLGFASVSYDKLTNDIVCKSAHCDGSVLYTGTHDGESDTRFASSLHAGASFDLTSQLKLDAGYSYTRIFEGDAFGWDEADKSFGESGVQGKDHGFNIHALRAGLRYSFY